MLRSFLTSLLLIAFVPFASLAEDSQLHWYRVVVSAGNAEATFTGSSRYDADQLVAHIRDNQFIELENQRDVVAKSGESKPHMQAVCEGEKLYIAGHTVLYFSELPKDPAVPAK